MQTETSTNPQEQEYARTASEMLAEFRSGRRRVRDYVETLLARHDEVEPRVLAFEAIDPDAVRQRADNLDAQGPNGGLYGIPFAAKDIIDSADLPTQYGSPIYSGAQPFADAACISIGTAAGGILLGKSVTTEFANVTPGKTRNPFDPKRTPGGSSSGSAAAVAAGMTPLALGTQTTSSTIRPASYCGIYGYISSFGDLSMSGIRQAAWSLDRLGLFARSVDDIHLYRSVLCNAEYTPLPDQSVVGLRVGLCRTHLWDNVEAYAQRAIEDAAFQLSRAGAHVTDLTLPQHFSNLPDAHRWISSYEFTRNFAYEITHHNARISEALRNGRIKDGLSCPHERYIASKALGIAARREFTAMMNDFDVLITMGASGEAPEAATTGNFAFCAIWTILHGPCITIPAFCGPHGLPVGLQIVGRPGHDTRLLANTRTIAATLDVRVGAD